MNSINYAILSAMPEELDFISTEFAKLPFTEIKLKDLSFRVYEYQDNKVLIAHTGIGTGFAASVLTWVHLCYNPEYFLVCGTAGGIKSGVEIRDVVIAEKAFEAEMKEVLVAVKGTPFESCLRHPLKNIKLPDYYDGDLELLNVCKLLNLANIKIHQGTVVSSNAFPAPIELFKRIKTFDPYSIDMETSAFYQAAWLLNAKIIAIRGISNILDSNGLDENIHLSDIKGSSLAASTVTLSLLDNLILNKKNKRVSEIDPVSKLIKS